MNSDFVASYHMCVTGSVSKCTGVGLCEPVRWCIGNSLALPQDPSTHMHAVAESLAHVALKAEYALSPHWSPNGMLWHM